jgi:purine nucleosidase/pyrimidine-specific ribonucleoside hydrolase
MTPLSQDHSVSTQAQPLSVLVDTDPGLDDALALFLACASPMLEIAGIVTVAGNIGLARVTENALALLAHADRNDIPVVAGAASPLERRHLTAAEIHGDDGLGGVALEAPPRAALTTDATSFMSEELTRRPERTLRILALGPLTNVARLVQSHPSFAARLERVVAMGGAVREAGNVTPFAEFNIAADPEAADVVLRSGIPLTLVPLDVTRKVTADLGFCTRLRETGGKVAATSAALIEAYLRNLAARRQAKAIAALAGQPLLFPLHDPCVVLHAIRPDLFGSERLPVRIITDRSEHDGQTIIDERQGAEIEVLTQAKPEAIGLAFDLLRGLP